MRNLKKTRRIQVIILLALVLALGTVLIGVGMKDGIEFFKSPSQVLSEPPAQDERFRLGGLVAEGSVVRGAGEEVSFTVTDGGAQIPVRFKGVLPDLFAENAGMIGTGTMQDGVFVAAEILAKHDENYMPKEVMDALKEQGVYQPQTE